MNRSRKITALLLSIVWLGGQIRAGAVDQNEVYAQLEAPITLGDGKSDLSLEDALREVAERTGWVIAIDHSVDLTGFTVPAQHPSLRVCFARLSQAAGLDFSLDGLARLAIFFVRGVDRVGLPRDDLLGRISEEAADKVDSASALLDVAESVWDSQGKALSEPPYRLRWSHLSAEQRELVRTSVEKPWPAAQVSWDELGQDLELFVGAAVIAQWRIGAHSATVFFRSSLGFPRRDKRGWYARKRPSVPIQLPNQDEGIYTVDELLALMSEQTHQEIYAEPDLGGKELRLIGPGRTLSDGSIKHTIRRITGGLWQRVEEVLLLSLPDHTDLGRFQRLEDKNNLLFREYNERFLDHVNDWLDIGDLGFDPASRPCERRLREFEPALQEELVISLERGLDDPMKQIVGPQFFRANWLAESTVQLTPKLGVVFFHPEYGQYGYACSLLP